MAPPHHAERPSNSKSYSYARDPTRARGSPYRYDAFSSKRTFHFVQLGTGCHVPLDEAGLPASRHIEHGRGCVCAGYQRALVMNLLWKWVTVDAVLLQVEPAAARSLAEDLMRSWHLSPMTLDEVVQALTQWGQAVEQSQRANRSGY